MRVVRIVALLFGLVFASSHAHAQLSQTALQTLIANNLPSQSNGAITPAIMVATLDQIALSYNQSGSACATGTLSPFQPFTNTAVTTATTYGIYNPTTSTCLNFLTFNQTTGGFGFSPTPTVSTSAFSFSVTLNPTTTLVTPVLFIENLTGSASSTAYTMQVGNNNDNLNDPNGLFIGYFQDVANGASLTGNRTVVQSLMDFSHTSSNSGTTFYTANGMWAYASAADGGNPNLAGGNTVCSLLAGATGWTECESFEADVSIGASASATAKMGINIVLLGTGAPSPLAPDRTQATYSLGLDLVAEDTSTPGFKTGISFGNPFGYWPIATTGTMIGTTAPITTDAYAAAYGVDFNNVVFSTAFLRANNGVAGTVGFLEQNGAATLSPNLGAAPNATADAIVLSDTVVAAAGNQQFSPALHFIGQGWKTNATAASQQVEYINYLVPVQGTANPMANLVWAYQNNGGGYNTVATLTADNYAAGFGTFILNGTNGSAFSLEVAGTEEGRFLSSVGSFGVQVSNGGTLIFSTAAGNRNFAQFAGNTNSGGEFQFVNAPTIASASGATLDEINIEAETQTISGSTNITTAAGFNIMSIYRSTYVASSAITITNAASLAIANCPLAGTDITITNCYALWVQAGASMFAGTVSSTAGFIANGNTGITQTCTVNQAKTLVFTLGILTSGSCNS